MKTLKIILLLALFVVVSSQTDQASANSESAKKVDIQEATKIHYDLLAHTRDRVVIPTRG